MIKHTLHHCVQGFVFPENYKNSPLEAFEKKHCTKMPLTRKNVYTYMARRANRNKNRIASPSYKEIADSLQICLLTVKRAIKDLIKWGFIICTKKPGLINQFYIVNPKNDPLDIVNKSNNNQSTEAVDNFGGVVTLSYQGGNTELPDSELTPYMYLKEIKKKKKEADAKDEISHSKFADRDVPLVDNFEFRDRDLKIMRDKKLNPAEVHNACLDYNHLNDYQHPIHEWPYYVSKFVNNYRPIQQVKQINNYTKSSNEPYNPAKKMPFTVSKETRLIAEAIHQEQLVRDSMRMPQNGNISSIGELLRGW